METLKYKVAGKRFLVTGGTGFFGTNFKSFVEQLDGHVTTIGSKYDLSDEKQSEHLFSEILTDKYDYIIHAAALQAAGDWPLFHKAEQYDINLRIHANTFRMWKKYQPQAKMIGIGSSCSYPKTKEVLSESDYWDGAMHESVDIYGFTKKAVSVGIESYKSQFGLKGTTVIFATLYGPHDHFDPEKSHVVSALVKKFVDGKINKLKEVEVWGDGTQTRELIYVDDQIRALLSVLDYDGSLINIGTGNSVTIKELADTIKKVVNFEGDIIYNTNKFVGVKHKVLDVSLARQLYGWTSDIIPDTLTNNLKKTIDWYIQKSNKIQLANRRALVEYANQLGIRNAIEVGVRHGHYSKFILDNSKIDVLYAVDPWEKNAELDDANQAYENCKNRLEPFGDRAVIIKGYSPNVCADFEDETIDFIYIDGLHDYESVKKDIVGWYSKLRKGYIIAGHDYSFRWPGVIQAVNQFVEENSLVLNLTGIGAEDNELEQDGGEPSWWIVKL